MFSFFKRNNDDTVKIAKRFNTPQLIAVVILVVAVGSYFLYSSFAASPVIATLEAEHMTPLPAGASVVNDTTASGGQAVKITTISASVRGSVALTSAATSLGIVVKGTTCQNNWPQVSVSVDGTAVISSAKVNSTSWITISPTKALNLAIGTHKVIITGSGFVGCTKSLYADVINFNGINTGPPPAPTVAISASPAMVNSGGTSTITWTSTNATGCTASGAWSGSESTTGSYPTGGLSTTSTYNISCTGAGGTATGTTTVTVNPGTGGAAKGYGVSMSCDLICFQSTSNKQAEFSDIAATGAKWVRFDAFWSEWEPTKGQYNQNNINLFNQTVQIAESYGLSVLPVLWSTPSWANGNQSVNAPPTNVSDWTNFVSTVVNDGKPYNLHDFEIWNEENSTSFFTGTVTQYTQLLINAYKTIKNSEPNSLVLLGGMTPQGDHSNALPSSVANWLTSVYANGGGGYFDAVATHPYIDGSSNSNGTLGWSGWYQMNGSSPSIRSVMIANGDSNKLIWGTEWGYNLNGYLPAPSESVIQQNISLDVNNWNSYQWSGVLFWYTDTDDNSTGGFGLSLPNNYSFPAAHRPRWTSYQTAITKAIP